MTKLLFRFAVLFVSVTVITACSSSSDDTPTTDPTDDTGGGDPTDDTGGGDPDGDTETVSYLKSMERQNPDGSLIRRVELNYNTQNQIASRTITSASGTSATISVGYDGELLTTLFTRDAATGEELVGDVFEYDSRDRLVLWTSYVFDNVVGIYAYEYDAQDRLTSAIYYQDQAAYDNDASLTRNDYIYADDSAMFYERVSVNTSGGTETIVYKERNTSISSQSSSLNIGPGGENAPLNILLLTLIREDFYIYPNYILTAESIDLDTDEPELTISEVTPVFDTEGRITSANVKYYSSSSGDLISDENYIWTYEER
jgi:hypothetical protein